MPIRASRASGRAVRHRMMIRVVSEKLRPSTGRPTARAKITASMTFLVRNIPPKRVPPSIKLGGIT